MLFGRTTALCLAQLATISAISDIASSGVSIRSEGCRIGLTMPYGRLSRLSVGSYDPKQMQRHAWNSVADHPTPR
jgi:hypothetical protein